MKHTLLSLYDTSTNVLTVDNISSVPLQKEVNVLLSNYIEAIKGSAGGADDVTELEDDEEDDGEDDVNEPEEKRSKTS